MIVHFRNENLRRADFVAHSVWCPYQYPEELNELKEWGVSDDLICREILDRVEADHCHPCYSIPEGVTTLFRDLIYLAVDVKFETVEQMFFGYLAISDGNATSLTVFHHEEEFFFLNDEFCSAENDAQLKELFQTSTLGSMIVKIQPRRSLAGYSVPSVFDIPHIADN